MVKKSIILMLLLVLLMTGCGKKIPAETLPAETEATVTETVDSVPELAYATAQINGVPVVLETLSRGDQVEIVDAFDERHFVVKRQEGYGLVEKNLVRRDGETAFETWTGYAYRNAGVYDNYRLAGAPVQYLAADTSVEVLEDLGWCVLVELDGKTGYMKQESLAGKPQENNGAAGSGPGSGQGSAGKDGGEIALLSVLVPQEGTVSGKAVVLADGTQILLGYFDRGEKIPVVQERIREENLTVYLDGLYATVSGAYVHTGETQADPSWDGKCTQIASVYADRWMLGSPIDRLNANTGVKVLFELDNCYLVDVNGITGYVKKDCVAAVQPDVPEETVKQSEKPAATEPKQSTAATEPAPTTSKKEPVPTEPKETSAPTEPKEEVTTPTEPVDNTVPTEITEPAETEKPGDSGTTGGNGGNTGNPSREWTPPIL